MRLFYLLITFTFLIASCTNSDPKDAWIVDTFFTESEDKDGQYPARLQAFAFDKEGVLQNFYVQDLAWKDREIGHFRYTKGLLSRVLVENEFGELQQEIAIYYDDEGVISTIREPNRLPTSGSRVTSVQLIRKLSALMKDPPPTPQIVELFRSEALTNQYDLKTDVIPLIHPSRADLEPLRALVAGKNAVAYLDFRINAKDYVKPYYERTVVVQISGVDDLVLDGVSREQMLQSVATLVDGDKVMKAMNTYELRLPTDQTMRVGHVDMLIPDRVFVFPREEIAEGL